MQRGIYYLEDELLAEKFDREQQKTLEQKNIILHLEEQASEASVKWLIAKENRAKEQELKELKSEYEKANALLEKEQKKSLNSTSKLIAELKIKNKETQAIRT